MKSNAHSQNDEQKIFSEEDSSWDCTTCASLNKSTHTFCPKCGTKNDKKHSKSVDVTTAALSNLKIDYNKNDFSDLSKETDNKLNINLLKFMGAIGQDKKFSPGETRQCGWVFENESGHIIKMTISIVLINEGDKLVQTDFEKEYRIKLKPKEHFYLLFNVKAPAATGKYTNLYQLITHDCKIIPHMLQLMVDVKNVFTDVKSFFVCFACLFVHLFD